MACSPPLILIIACFYGNINMFIAIEEQFSFGLELAKST